MKRTAARVTLADAILTRDQIAQYIKVAEEARDDAVARWAGAARELDKIEAEEREAANVGHSIIAAMGRGDAEKVRTIVRTESNEARKAELREEVETWARAKEEIKTTIADYQKSLEFAEHAVSNAARAVVADDANVARLRDGLDELEAEVARRRRALAFIASVSEPDKRLTITSGLDIGARALVPRHSHDDDWASALAALKHDADAALPA